MTSRFATGARVLLAVLGGYFFAAGSAGLGAAGLSCCMKDSEAVVLMAMLAFVIYLALALWAFAEPRLVRVALALGIVGPLLFAASVVPAFRSGYA